jgi:hypothetical protein
MYATVNERHNEDTESEGGHKGCSANDTLLACSLGKMNPTASRYLWLLYGTRETLHLLSALITVLTRSPLNRVGLKSSGIVGPDSRLFAGSLSDISIQIKNKRGTAAALLCSATQSVTGWDRKGPRLISASVIFL